MGPPLGVPSHARLVRWLAADRTLPRGVRVQLWLRMVYLAVPIALVPDVLPVVGHADDAIVVARPAPPMAGPRCADTSRRCRTTARQPEIESQHGMGRHTAALLDVPSGNVEQ